MGAREQLLKLADLVAARPLGALLGAVWPRRPAAPPSAPPRRVLVIRPGGIGDAVLVAPMLAALRAAWPAASITLLLERRNAGVLDGAGLADETLLYDRPLAGLLRAVRGRFDLVVDTEQYHAASALVAYLGGAPRRIGFGTNARRRLLTTAVPYSQETYEARSFLDLARAATGAEPAWDPEAPFFPLRDEERAFAARTLAPLGDRPLVVVHPGASIPERRWPAERYGFVAAGLADDGAAIAIVGGASDRAAGRTIAAALGGRPHVDLCGATTLREAAAVIARAAVYVSADTGLLHLAYALGVPSVHLFGPGVLAKWGPPGKRYVSVREPTPCSPCTTYGYTPPCCQGMACMLGIAPERVLAAARARLAAGKDGAAADEGGAA